MEEYFPFDSAAWQRKVLVRSSKNIARTAFLANINDERTTSKKNFPSLASLSNTLQLAVKKTAT